MRRKFQAGILMTSPPEETVEEINELQATGRYGSMQHLLRSAIHTEHGKVFGDRLDRIEERLAALERKVK